MNPGRRGKVPVVLLSAILAVLGFGVTVITADNCIDQRCAIDYGKGAWQTDLSNDGIFDGLPSWSVGVSITETVYFPIFLKPQPIPLNFLVAFSSERNGINNNFGDIYTMRQDGTDIVRLTTYPSSRDDPASWSADGKKLAFHSKRKGHADIYVMNADGSNQTRLTNNGTDNYNPAWSPDGRKIIFESRLYSCCDLLLMNSDGSNVLRFIYSPVAYFHDPVYSPDGSQIAFAGLEAYSFPQAGDIYVMGADGSNVINLTNRPGGQESSGPEWSPDGSQIAFSLMGEIYVMKADGSNLTRLTYSPGDDKDPCWSPDALTIVFSSERDGNHEIYMMQADGSEQTNLTNNEHRDFSPSCSPAVE